MTMKKEMMHFLNVYITPLTNVIPHVERFIVNSDLIRLSFNQRGSRSSEENAEVCFGSGLRS